MGKEDEMEANNDTASRLQGIADVIWEVMRKEHTLSNGARAALGGCVADLEDVIKKVGAASDAGCDSAEEAERYFEEEE